MNQTKELQEVKEVQFVKEESLKNYPELEEDTIFYIDCETGGLNSEINSLLDVHFKSAQSDYKKTFHFCLNGIVEHEALMVNRLNWIDLKNRNAESKAEMIKILQIKPMIFF